MRRMSRKLILSLVLVLVIGVLGGCGNKKAPEGVSQQFYDDMLASSNDLIKTTKNAKNLDLLDSDIFKGSGYETILLYLDDESLTLIEMNILESLHDIYLDSAMYHNDVKLYGMDSTNAKDRLKDKVATFSKLMEIDFDVDKIILE